MTAENAAAVAAVVRRLDGIALAIELAAARVPAMTPAELARRLERSFARARGWPARRGGTSPDAAGHDRLVLRAAHRPEQALLARLAVFAGGATLEAVEAVCGGDGIDPDAVFELLAGLVARSLVVAEEQGARDPLPAAGDDPPVRRGTPRGEPGRPSGGGPATPATTRTSSDGSATMPTTANQEMFWAVRLSAEQDNLLAAWSWAIGAGNVDTAFTDPGRLRAERGLDQYPLLLAGEAALDCPARPSTRATRWPWRSARCSRRFARDVTGAEELCRRAAEANAAPRYPGLAGRGDRLRRPHRTSPSSAAPFADAARFAEQAAGLARAGGDLADASIELCLAAVADHVLAGDAPAAVPLAREATRARPRGRRPCPDRDRARSAWAYRSPAPTPARLVPTCAKAARSAPRWAITAPWTCLATGIAFVIRDRAAALELGRQCHAAASSGAVTAAG